MPEDAKIGPVPRRKWPQALRFVAAGGESDAGACAQGALLENMVAAREAGGAIVWWGRRGSRCLAAAAILNAPGRVGMIFASPAEARGVDADVLADVIRRASLEALGGGRAFVQSLTEPQASADISVLEAAGFRRLAELIYMELDLAKLPDAAETLDWVWQDCANLDERRLGELILRTYDGSLDCPGLAGVRTIADVIAAHKNTGRFTPQWWWIVAPAAGPQRGVAAGCILVNEVDELTAEVAYMGVAPEHRGKGLGAAMVRGAAQRLRRCGIRQLTLAVDSANTYARRIYDGLGFVETHRRVAYMIISPKTRPQARSH